MLQLPPHLINRKERRAREARRGKIGETRFNVLVREIARVIRLAFEAGATASLWGLEGPLRAGIRSDLCLQGWRWKEADAAARDLLDDAFRVAGAIRPSWNEGQPEWVTHPGTLINRDCCAHCRRPLPDGMRKFCGSVCRNASFYRQMVRKEATEEQALDLAIRTL
ncbi:hypothetical protein CDV50_04900 [Haematobacter massiliensis]|uniref:hypothetical protein n=1 Tax=Haematobacter massiliensis TaxID=195105 RepID=UPI000B49AC9B|nr:hypothetical protein [Haematobacter massiliensis]OWJ72514.1 hypothetical protein CDV50_04900 [Haematobacter massiliensis]